MLLVEALRAELIRRDAALRFQVSHIQRKGSPVRIQGIVAVCQMRWRILGKKFVDIVRQFQRLGSFILHSLAPPV